MNVNHGKNSGPDHEPEGRGALVGAQSGPTVLRIALGAQLRKYREASGLTTAEAAEVIRATHSKISRLERGRTTARQRDVADLLTLYGVTDEAERDKLLELTREASVPGWWQQYNDILPRWLELYIGLEKAASIIRSYEMQFIHGLRGELHVTWEEGTWAAGLYDLLKPHVHQNAGLRSPPQCLIKGRQ